MSDENKPERKRGYADDALDAARRVSEALSPIGIQVTNIHGFSYEPNREGSELDKLGVGVGKCVKLSLELYVPASGWPKGSALS